MRYIIDRFEGKTAVCETKDRGKAEIPEESLPAGAKAGDVIILREDGSYAVDREATEERRRHIIKKMNDLFE